MTLADRIEQADGPSRELDVEIFLTVLGDGWRVQTDCALFPEQVQTGRVQEVSGCGWRNSPAYTSSIDAALTLVPAGWFWSITMRGEKRGEFHACCVRQGPLVWHEGITPALALCAAALRALTEDKPRQEGVR